MKRLLAFGAALAACLSFPLQSSAGGSGAVACPQDTNAFTGTATTLVVPAGGYCAITNAAIAQDLILEDGAGADVLDTTVGRDMRMGDEAGAGIDGSRIGRDLVSAGDGGADVAGVAVGRDVYVGSHSGMDFERTTIGHDLVAVEPQSIQTGRNGPDTPGGPVDVGHDVSISGTPADGEFVFDGICNLHVGHDLSVENRTVSLGFGIESSPCPLQGEPPNTVGHDLIVTGNTAARGFFGPSSLRIGNNRVGHDLIFTGNTAVPGGSLEVTANIVGHDAICADNTPSVTVFEPNTAGHLTTCG